ncbi:MAG: leucyl aminopeptidase family protein [Planctomycetes bacterium]|nr:leucyl aminopeptidase family protein [Planctomycetota bacterium]
MTKISFAKDPDALVKSSDTVLVVAASSVFQSKKLPKVFEPEVQALLARLGKKVEPGDRGAVGSTLTLAKPETLKIGVLPGSGSRHNSPMRADAIWNVVASSGIAKAKRGGIVLVVENADHALAACNAIARGTPLYSRKKKPTDGALRICVIDKRGKPVRIGNDVKETVNTSRAIAAMVDTPPTDLNPEEYAKQAKALLRGIPNVTVREIRGDALLTEKLAGVHAVGRTAVKAPRVLIAKYTPRGVTKGRHVCLVGKGITYDTGGLNIKISGAMSTMKGDMGGSAAVLGAFRILAATRAVKHPLSLVMCMAENAIGPDSYKPDDILTMHSGLTVEINNTDAEGRLLLADGVSYAARKLKADTIIDAATLTGAQLIATGTMHAAVFSNDEKLESLAVTSGRRSGDLCHPLPFAPEFYKAEFASPVADMRNSVKNRMNAQSSCAAQFVYWHIEDTDARWCHIDLAGPAFPSSRATGFGAALIAEMVRGLS